MKKEHYIVSGGALLFLITCWFSLGYTHGDEHFQIYEFAGYLLGWNNNDAMAWEFGARMRPTLQPILTAIGITTFNTLGITDPFFQAFLFRCLSAALLFFSILKFASAFQTTDKTRTVFLLLFFSMSSYLAARYSSEGLSASFLLLTLAQLNRASTARHFLIAGVFAGLSFAFRFQVAFAIVGIALWYVLNRKFNLKEVGACIAGFLTIFGISLLCDRYFYGEWVVAPFEYFYQNIVLNKASNYGVDPWYYYFRKLLKHSLFLPGLIALILTFWYAAKNPKNILVLACSFFLIGHMAVAHKEGRFMAPVMIPFAFLIILSLELIRHALTKRIVYIVLLIGNFVTLIPNVIFPASSEIQAMEFLEKKYPEPQFTIYYDQQSNPYENYGLFNKFYARKKPSKCRQSKFKDETFKQPSVWITYDCYESGKKIGSTRLKKIWQQYPEWITDNIDLNNGIFPSSVYTIYEMVPDSTATKITP